MMLAKFGSLWARFWMYFAGLDTFGRIATRLAILFIPPHYGRRFLSHLNKLGYIAPRAIIHHNDLHISGNVFIDDRVIIYQVKDGGPVEIGKDVRLCYDTNIQTGCGGSIKIGAGTDIQPRCQFSAFKASIQIGNDVQIGPNCAFYPYDHSYAPGELISKQPLKTKGGISIGDDAWLGFGVIVLDGVRIGNGAVVGAGSVVTHDVPDGAIAVGVPARVIKMRSEITNTSL